MAEPHSITPEFARSVVSYDPATGATVNSVGSMSVATSGYLRLVIGRKSYAVHRLVWVIEHGASPDGFIDHINGDRLDNRLSNLRCVTRQGNNQNQRLAQRSNKGSGLLGAYWNKRDKRWQSSICVDNKNRHLGNFSTAEDAHKAYLTAKRNLHATCTI